MYIYMGFIPWSFLCAIKLIKRDILEGGKSCVYQRFYFEISSVDIVVSSSMRRKNSARHRRIKWIQNLKGFSGIKLLSSGLSQ